jgi:hypothetical protein
MNSGDLKKAVYSAYRPPAPKESKKGGKRNSGQSDWAAWVRERNDPRIAHTKPEAPDDITVLDLSYKSYAGSYCSSMLSEFGARVLRIEPPEGDFLRSCTPGCMRFQGMIALSSCNVHRERAVIRNDSELGIAP